MNARTSSKLLEKIPTLKGKSNYVDWAEITLMALESNSLDSVLNSSVSKEEKDAHDRPVRAIILLSCSDEVRQTLKQKSTAQEVWKLAKTRYGTPSKLRTTEILSEFYGVPTQTRSCNKSSVGTSKDQPSQLYRHQTNGEYHSRLEDL